MQHYKPSSLIEWQKSVHYAALRYHHMDQSVIDAMYVFLDWAEYEKELPDEKLDELKPLVDEFLGDMNKVNAGEREMLDRWIKSATRKSKEND